LAVNPTSSDPFARPTGLLGRAAGWIMAALNAEMNRLAVEALALAPDDRVLEIGFGPGAALSRVAEHAAVVAGIDPSEAMLAEASRRLRSALAAGRASLARGTASSLPWPDGAFTKAYAVNSYQLWSDPARDLAEVRRVLAPGGVLVLGLRARSDVPGARARRWFDGIAEGPEALEAARAAVRQAGFTEERFEVKPAGWMSVALLRARR
jgi:ubiquinone/menaquinone biosynthesis C-methylase UbiE